MLHPMEPQLLDYPLVQPLMSYQQFFDQVKINSTTQLINGIFKALQKLLKYFSGITTFAFINESLFCGVFPTILVLYLKDLESEERGLLGSFL